MVASGRMLDPAFLSVLSHPARLQALVLLERGPASSRELAAEVGLKPSAMAHHVRRLDESGLIEQVDSRRRRAFDERIWRTRGTGWAELEQLLLSVSVAEKP
jgi:DNA-binding transcriptional ArsR family regulator